MQFSFLWRSNSHLPKGLKNWIWFGDTVVEELRNSLLCFCGQSDLSQFMIVLLFATASLDSARHPKCEVSLYSKRRRFRNGGTSSSIDESSDMYSGNKAAIVEFATLSVSKFS